MGDNNSGIGIVGVLTIIFVVLKLTNLIAWSWWWVLSPLWIGAIIAVFILFIVGLVVLITQYKIKNGK